MLQGNQLKVVAATRLQDSSIESQGTTLAEFEKPKTVTTDSGRTYSYDNMKVTEAGNSADNKKTLASLGFQPGSPRLWSGGQEVGNALTDEKSGNATKLVFNQTDAGRAGFQDAHASQNSGNVQFQNMDVGLRSEKGTTTIFVKPGESIDKLGATLGRYDMATDKIDRLATSKAPGQTIQKVFSDIAKTDPSIKSYDVQATIGGKDTIRISGERNTFGQMTAANVSTEKQDVAVKLFGKANVDNVDKQSDSQIKNNPNGRRADDEVSRTYTLSGPDTLMATNRFTSNKQNVVITAIVNTTNPMIPATFSANREGAVFMTSETTVKDGEQEAGKQAQRVNGQPTNGEFSYAMTGGVMNVTHTSTFIALMPDGSRLQVKSAVTVMALQATKGTPKFDFASASLTDVATGREVSFTGNAKVAQATNWLSEINTATPETKEASLKALMSSDNRAQGLLSATVKLSATETLSVVAVPSQGRMQPLMTLRDVSSGNAVSYLGNGRATVADARTWLATAESHPLASVDDVSALKSKLFTKENVSKGLTSISISGAVGQVSIVAQRDVHESANTLFNGAQITIANASGVVSYKVGERTQMTAISRLALGLKVASYRLQSLGDSIKNVAGRSLMNGIGKLLSKLGDTAVVFAKATETKTAVDGTSQATHALAQLQGVKTYAEGVALAKNLFTTSKSTTAGLDSVAFHTRRSYGGCQSQRRIGRHKNRWHA